MTTMDRRQFLAAIGATWIAVQTPPAFGQVRNAVRRYAVVDRQLGRALIFSTDTWQEYGDWLIDTLIEDARETLPPGTPFEIRRSMSTDYGRTGHLGWIASPGMKHDSFVRHPVDSLAFHPENGCWEVARLVT